GRLSPWNGQSCHLSSGLPPARSGGPISSTMRNSRNVMVLVLSFDTQVVGQVGGGAGEGGPALAPAEAGRAPLRCHAPAVRAVAPEDGQAFFIPNSGAVAVARRVPAGGADERRSEGLPVPFRPVLAVFLFWFGPLLVGQ